MPILNHLSSRDERRFNGAKEKSLFRLRVVLLTAFVPTLLIAAILALGFAVRGTPLAPGWASRAVIGAALVYICSVGLMLFSTRKAGKP